MKNIAFLAKIGLTAGLLWLVASQVDAREALRNIGSFTALCMVLVFGLLTLQQLIAAGRLSVVMAMLGERLGLAAATRVTLVGFFFGQTFLSFLGGDAARLWELSRRNISVSKATSGILLDRLLGLIANHMLVLALLPWMLDVVVAPAPRLTVIAVAVAGAGGIALLFILAYMRGKFGLERRITALIGEHRAIPLVFDLVSVLRVSFAAPALMAAALAIGVVVNALNAVMIFLLFADLGVNVSLFQCLVLVPLIMELALIPVSVAGWGVREGLMVVAFGMAGVNSGLALSVSVMFGLAGVAFGLVGCAAWLMQNPAGRART